MTDIAIKRLEFARGEGEALATGRVQTCLGFNADLLGADTYTAPLHSDTAEEAVMPMLVGLGMSERANPHVIAWAGLAGENAP